MIGERISYEHQTRRRIRSVAGIDFLGCGMLPQVSKKWDDRELHGTINLNMIVCAFSGTINLDI